MVSRSQDPQANFVTQEQISVLTISLNEAMNTLRVKFAEQDQKFGIVEQRVLIMESAVGARLTERIMMHQERIAEAGTNIEMCAMKVQVLDVAYRTLEDNLAAEFNKLRAGNFEALGEATRDLQRLMNLAESCARDHEERLQKVEQPNRSGTGKRDILDPRQ